MGSFDKAPLTAELRRGSAVGGYGHIAELEVRIQFPPADSPGLAQTGPLQVENRGFHAGVRRWVGGAVGRDAQALVGNTRTGADISAGSYSSTAVVLTSSRVIAAVAAQSSCCWAQLLKAKPSTVRCSCQPSGKRECASSSPAVRSRG